VSSCWELEISPEEYLQTPQSGLTYLHFLAAPPPLPATYQGIEHGLAGKEVKRQNLFKGRRQVD
jgi:hypothetical protein